MVPVAVRGPCSPGLEAQNIVNRKLVRTTARPVALLFLSLVLVSTSILAGIMIPASGPIGDRPASQSPSASAASGPTVSSYTTFVNNATATGSSAKFSVGAADSLIVWVAQHGKATVSSVSDSLGNTFTLAGSSGYYLDQHGPERVTTYTSYNISHSGSDSVTVSTTTYSWTVVIAADITNVPAKPLDSQSAFTNSSQAGQTTTTVANSVTAHSGDVVFLVGGIRGPATVGATGGDTLVASAQLSAGYNSETAGIFRQTQGSTSGNMTLKATNSNNYAPWVANGLALKPISNPCPGSCGSGPLKVYSHANLTFNAASGKKTGIQALPGDFILVFVDVRSGSATVQKMGDTAGDSFHQLAYSTIAKCCKNGLAVWGAVNVSRGTNETLTVNLSAGATTVVVITVFDGADKVHPVLALSPFAWGNYSTAISTSMFAASGNAVVMNVAEWGQYPISQSGTTLLDEASLIVPFANETGANFLGQVTGSNSTIRLNATLAAADAWIAVAVEVQPATGVPPNLISHVVLIPMENHALYQVVQSGPYEGYLAAKYSRATSYYALCHPSVPNYIAMTSGALYQCGTDNYNTYGTTNIADLLEKAGMTWGSYLENMPTACNLTSSGSFTVHHDPFVYYSDVVQNASRCSSHVLNSRAFSSSIVNGSLPSFSMYTPNMTNDCHNSGISTCDAWLKGFLGPILNATGSAERKLVNHTIFFVTYDESQANDTTGVGGAGGGHLYFVAISPWSLGLQYGANATHYNLLTTLEWLLGLNTCGNHDGTSASPAMKSLFAFP
jgi:phosphatidylinositol-3-phosphatase